MACSLGLVKSIRSPLIKVLNSSFSRHASCETEMSSVLCLNSDTSSAMVFMFGCRV